jgi:hypothetical protein
MEVFDATGNAQLCLRCFDRAPVVWKLELKHNALSRALSKLHELIKQRPHLERQTGLTKASNALASHREAERKADLIARRVDGMLKQLSEKQAAPTFTLRQTNGRNGRRPFKPVETTRSSFGRFWERMKTPLSDRLLRCGSDRLWLWHVPAERAGPNHPHA